MAAAQKESELLSLRAKKQAEEQAKEQAQKKSQSNKNSGGEFFYPLPQTKFRRISVCGLIR